MKSVYKDRYPIMVFHTRNARVVQISDVHFVLEIRYVDNMGRDSWQQLAEWDDEED